MTEDLRVGAILFDYRGLKFTYYPTMMEGGDYDLTYNSETGLPQSGTVKALFEYGDVIANTLRESPMTEEVARQGAQPQARASNYPPQTQAAPWEQEPLFCKQCQGPAKVKPGTQPMKSRFAPYQMQVPAECTQGCKNPKGYPLATWIDV